jgi:putative N6-adenine-specific DNA methylase
LPHSKYFATCARALEPVLADELRELGAAAVEPGRGGVSFAGDTTFLYRANLWLRTAIRVLVPMLEADVASTDELYEAIQTIDWSAYLTPDHTLAVDCNVRDSAITHSQYAARRVKDAICDQFVQKVGRRPSVDVEEPMLFFNLHVHRNHMVLSLDSSGESLHKRGYRPALVKAPLNEALAAGLIRLTGWRGDMPFADPLCGSGALPIEAAWLALKRPPGLTRKRFGFMGWMDYDVQLWTALRDEARQGVLKQLPAPIQGSELRADVVDFARKIARAAGLGSLVRFERQDLADFRPPPGPPGVILCNPPYGERIGEEKELIGLYRKMGEVFRASGWQGYVFTGNPNLARELGAALSEVKLFNGKIPCRLVKVSP